MTDKELEKKAFEYREKLVPYTELGYPDVEIPVYSALHINKAYIEGAKENGVIWHDLRKNPNDLPDTDRNVLVKRESEENTQLDNYYNDDDYIGWGAEQWDREYYKRKGDVGYPSDVIAWCEIPKFKVE